MNLSAMDNDGNPVDWWFMYKVAGKSKTKSGKNIPGLTGAEYVYFDASEGSNAKLIKPQDLVNRNGALPDTLTQLYATPGASTEHLGWFFYNDEDPVSGKTNGTLGHTKGVLAFDFSSDTAFWLVQSTPKFPPKGKYDFPDSGMPNAQTLLCITLQNADVSRKLANQMFIGQQPNVYLSSPVPADLVKQSSDPRVQLIEGKTVEGNTPYSGSVPFNSRGGVKFTSIAKNRYWGLDFYNDLVGPTLHDDLDVETWEHGTTPPSIDSDKVHTVVDMGGIDLNPLGYDIVWPETDDHAKLAISARSEQTHFICVGDINFTLSMRKRSGGTVAFKCEPLWKSISSILTDVTTHLKTGSRAADRRSRRQGHGGGLQIRRAQPPAAAAQGARTGKCQKAQGGSEETRQEEGEEKDRLTRDTSAPSCLPRQAGRMASGRARPLAGLRGVRRFRRSTGPARPLRGPLLTPRIPSAAT